ncbi:MAG: hypothetical protein LBV70_02825, partial [Candidatus Adiutrix sp.]|nr:hypothetical protein [Candidatus Adiutrix sp.]
MMKTSRAQTLTSAAGAKAGAATAAGGKPAVKTLSARPPAPKPPAAAARQSIVVQPAASPKPALAKPAKKRRHWPILEAALILVLMKIAAGALYIWNRPGETGWDGFSSLRQARQAEPEPGLESAEALPEAALLELLNSPEFAMGGPPKVASEAAAAAPPEAPVEGAAEAKPAETPEVAAAVPPEAAVKGPAEALFAEYLAAALKATQP